MIKVLSSGFYASIQDLGRYGYRSIGVPVGGLMDSYSGSLVNILLENNLNDAVIEVFFGGVRLLFLENCYLCVSGADFSVSLDSKLIKLNVPFLAKKGSILAFGKRKYGVRTYIGVKGGIKTDKVLKSRSWLKGITSKVKLEKEMLLPFEDSFKYQLNKFRGVVRTPSSFFLNNSIQCLEGAEFNLLSNNQKQALASQHFVISNDNSRMGYRLNKLIPNNFDSMLTSVVLPGTVQLTPSGKLVVLMRDCQVTGGYPRVLQLTENGINRLAQRTTNDSLQFIINKSPYI